MIEKEQSGITAPLINDNERALLTLITKHEMTTQDTPLWNGIVGKEKKNQDTPLWNVIVGKGKKTRYPPLERNRRKVPQKKSWKRCGCFRLRVLPLAVNAGGGGGEEKDLFVFTDSIERYRGTQGARYLIDIICIHECMCMWTYIRMQVHAHACNTASVASVAAIKETSWAVIPAHEVSFIAVAMRALQPTLSSVKLSVSPTPRECPRCPFNSRAPSL